MKQAYSVGAALNLMTSLATENLFLPEMSGGLVLVTCAQDLPKNALC